MALRKVTAVAMIALVALLASCSSIDRGTITNKDHREGYYYTTYTQQCTAYDKNGICTSYIPIPHQNYQQPTWRFDIRLEDENGWVYVSEDTYNNYEVGDFYGQ